MTLAQKWQNAVCTAESCRGCRLALIQHSATTEEKRRKLKRKSADGQNSIMGQRRLRKSRAEGRRRLSLCCVELQILCTQSIGYYARTGKKKNKANSVCLLSHKMLHDGDSSSGASNPPLPTPPTPTTAVQLPHWEGNIVIYSRFSGH